MRICRRSHQVLLVRQRHFHIPDRDIVKVPHRASQIGQPAPPCSWLTCITTPERFVLSGLSTIKAAISFDTERHTLGVWKTSLILCHIPRTICRIHRIHRRTIYHTERKPMLSASQKKNSLINRPLHQKRKANTGRMRGFSSALRPSV